MWDLSIKKMKSIVLIFATSPLRSCELRVHPMQQKIICEVSNFAGQLPVLAEELVVVSDSLAKLAQNQQAALAYFQF